jgi:hypothetical protein
MAEDQSNHELRCTGAVTQQPTFRGLILCYRWGDTSTTIGNTRVIVLPTKLTNYRTPKRWLASHSPTSPAHTYIDIQYIHTYIHTCTHICIYIYIYIHTYTHTCIHTRIHLISLCNMPISPCCCLLPNL